MTDRPNDGRRTVTPAHNPSSDEESRAAEDLLASAPVVRYTAGPPNGIGGIITAAELKRALSLAYPAPDVERIVDRELAAGLSRPTRDWDEEILLLVALLSRKHYDRVRRHRGWSVTELEAKLEPHRKRLGR